MTETSDLLTDKEAAQFLRLSTLTLWRLRKRGELPFVRLATKLLYRRSDLIAFIERNQRNAEVTK
jgi:excisionase family DNA binding protein